LSKQQLDAGLRAERLAALPHGEVDTVALKTQDALSGEDPEVDIRMPVREVSKVRNLPA